MDTLPYQITEDDFNAAAPYRVIAMFRSFNKGMGRYETLQQAKRRAAWLNNRTDIICDLTGKWVRS